MLQKERSSVSSLSVVATEESERLVLIRCCDRGVGV